MFLQQAVIEGIPTRGAYLDLSTNLQSAGLDPLFRRIGAELWRIRAPGGRCGAGILCGYK
jgi:hypothetical protein